MQNGRSTMRDCMRLDQPLNIRSCWGHLPPMKWWLIRKYRCVMKSLQVFLSKEKRCLIMVTIPYRAFTTTSGRQKERKKQPWTCCYDERCSIYSSSGSPLTQYRSHSGTETSPVWICIMFPCTLCWGEENLPSKNNTELLMVEKDLHTQHAQKCSKHSSTDRAWDRHLFRKVTQSVIFSAGGLTWLTKFLSNLPNLLTEKRERETEVKSGSSPP